ncbi:SerA Phosphoglycerate dehydrogenase and related dehydrogenases [Burkholderiales bacterium]
MKLKVLYHTILNYSHTSKKKLEDNFDVVSIEKPGDDIPCDVSEIIAAFAPLGYKFDEQYLSQFVNLRYVCTNTTGIQHIDAEYCCEQRIEIIGLHDQQKFLKTITPTAEHTLLLILALQRGLCQAQKSVLFGNEWNRRSYGGKKMLSRQTIGIIGYGRIGQMVGRVLRSLGSKIIFFDPYVPGSQKSILDVAKNSDVISVHAVANSETKNLIDFEFFHHCKANAIFVNTARAEIVNQDALLDALTSKKIAGASLDVLAGEYDQSFDPSSNALVALAKANSNLIITPHIGGSTEDAWAETEGQVIDRLISISSK